MNICTYCDKEFFDGVIPHCDNLGHKANVGEYHNKIILETKELYFGEGTADDDDTGDNRPARFSRRLQSVKANNQKSRVR